MNTDSNDVMLNTSILVDEEKILTQLGSVLESRGLVGEEFGFNIPKSFSEISQDILEKIKDIDKIYQKGLLDTDVVIELIADLFESNEVIKKYETYVSEVLKQRLNDLYELLEIKCRKLLNSLNTGVIDKEEFVSKYTELRVLKANYLSKMLKDDEVQGN